MKDEVGHVLYVGKAKNLKNRIKQYFLGTDTRAQIPYLIKQVEEIDTIVVTSEKEALILENNLIKKHWPKYNACLKDDKTYLSLMINHKHTWPMIRVVRFKGNPPNDALYFGPYTNGFAAKQTLELLRRLFPLRQCSDRELLSRKRPCILYDLKQCVAPCVGKCTKESYDSLVKKAVTFLRGHDASLIKDLRREMENAAEKLEFEKAETILKIIRNIETTIEQQKVQKTGSEDQDVLGMYREADRVAITQLFFREGKLIGSHDHFFNHNLEEDSSLISSFLLQHYQAKQFNPPQIHIPIPLEEQQDLSELIGVEIHFPKKGEKKKLLEMAQKNAEAKFKRVGSTPDDASTLLMAMEEELHLTNYPERIECFDNSNLSGSEPVSVMVVTIEGQKAKHAYRKYKIDPQIAFDDYAALREVLTRRYSKAKEAKEENALPDLLVIDGGKGHLNVALEVLEDLDISTVDVIAVAKEESKHTKGATLEKIFHPHLAEPIHLKAHSPLLFFLQKIRDEAHRFAITFQKVRRSKRVFGSQLEDLPGIGPVKRKRLLKTFGSVKRIKEASEEELLKVPGINKKDVIILLQKSKDDDII